MAPREEIALQLTKCMLERIVFRTDEIKTLPYEIYNSIYENIKTEDNPNIQVG